MIKNQSGQSSLEYILMVAIMVNVAIFVFNWFKQSQMDQKLMAPLNTAFANTYQYGHPLAQGFDNGNSPNANHPRAVVGGKVRLFINPR